MPINKININEYTVEELISIKEDALSCGRGAALQHLEENGEDPYCGFAWVNIYGIKGSTKLGRNMKKAGFAKDYSGAYSIWNPSGLGTQSMDVKEVGAQAAAQVFKQANFQCYAGSRPD